MAGKEHPSTPNGGTSLPPSKKTKGTNQGTPTGDTRPTAFRTWHPPLPVPYFCKSVYTDHRAPTCSMSLLPPHHAPPQGEQRENLCKMGSMVAQLRGRQYDAHRLQHVGTKAISGGRESANVALSPHPETAVSQQLLLHYCVLLGNCWTSWRPGLPHPDGGRHDIPSRAWPLHSPPAGVREGISKLGNGPHMPHGHLVQASLCVTTLNVLYEPDPQCVQVDSADMPLWSRYSPFL